MYAAGSYLWRKQQLLFSSKIHGGLSTLCVAVAFPACNEEGGKWRGNSTCMLFKFCFIRNIHTIRFQYLKVLILIRSIVTFIFVQYNSKIVNVTSLYSIQQETIELSINLYYSLYGERFKH